jgi:hypothetical protein
MGRRLQPLDPTAGPKPWFADQLRKLRVQAGNPSLAEIARLGRISETLATKAVRGTELPTWYAVEGYLRGCADAKPDRNYWLELWSETHDVVHGIQPPAGLMERTLAVTPRKAEPSATQPAGSGRVAVDVGAPEPLDEAPLPTAGGITKRRRWLIAAAVVAVVLAGLGIYLAIRSTHSHTTKSGGPAGPLVVIQNKVALGPNRLVEDTTPVYLSTKPQPYCKRVGCAVPNTEMSSAAVVPVICQVSSAYMVNYDLRDTSVQQNPNKAESTRWYWAALPDGRAGYISEVYIEPRFRGGLELPTCTDAITHKT